MISDRPSRMVRLAPRPLRCTRCNSIRFMEERATLVNVAEGIQLQRGCGLFVSRRATGHNSVAVDWPRLAEALLRHARENDVVETEPTRHGTRDVLDGAITAPDGTVLNVRSAWYIDPGGDAPRFVTAHPLPKV